jgi:catalase
MDPEQAIDAINTRFGRHPGARALHAKGTNCRGTFTASPAAAGLTRAAHMQGEAVPVTVRFSNGSGDPDEPDHAPDVRGMAIKFYLPDGTRTDVLAQNAPRFPTSTPEAFIGLVRAGEPGLGGALRMLRFLALHPRTARRLPANTTALLPPASYAACRYFAVHAFRWVAADGSARWVRYTLLPHLDERRPNFLAARRKGPNYLQQDIAERVAGPGVRFDLELQLAAPGDSVDDPAADWPSDRERLVAGTLELTGLDTERERDGDVLVFDPTRLTDGIEPSNDPVLRFREPAYGESIARRTAD